MSNNVKWTIATASSGLTSWSATDQKGRPVRITRVRQGRYDVLLPDGSKRSVGALLAAQNLAETWP